MKSADRDPVIHSSLSEVKRVGVDSDFPGYPASIGVIIRRGRFGGANIAYHTPKLSSLVTGESSECDPDELDSNLRVALSTMAGQCRTLAADLISHAERLEARMRDDVLIDESGASVENVGSATDTASGTDTDTDTDSEPERAARSSIAVDLSAFE